MSSNPAQAIKTDPDVAQAFKTEVAQNFKTDSAQDFKTDSAQDFKTDPEVAQDFKTDPEVAQAETDPELPAAAAISVKAEYPEGKNFNDSKRSLMRPRLELPMQIR